MREFTVNNKVAEFFLIFACAIIFGLIAHGYCYFNIQYSHDSLSQIYTYNTIGIAIGRIFRPLYSILISNFATPTLSGILALTLISVSAFFVVKILSIKNIIHKILITCIMVTNYTVTLTSATFIHDLCPYMISLLFAILGVYFYKKFKYGLILSSLCYCLVLGLYQAMIDVAIVLHMINIFFNIIKTNNVKNTLLDILKISISFVLAFLIYYLFVLLITYATNIPLNDSYNSISQAFTLGSKNSILLSIIYAYALFFYYFVYILLMSSFLYENIIGFINILSIILAILLILKTVRKKSYNLSSKLLIIVVVLLMPFGVNFVGFVAQGNEHELMIYSFCFVYIFIIKLIEYNYNCCMVNHNCNSSSLKNKYFKYFIPFIFGLLCFNFIIFSNQTYLWKNIVSEKSNAWITEVIEHIEKTDNYIPNQTKVAIVGDPEYSHIFNQETKFNTHHHGLEYHCIFTRYNIYRIYLKNVIYYPINIIQPKEAELLSKKEEVQQLSCFPSKNCTIFVDDVLVIKVSPEAKNTFYC